MPFLVFATIALIGAAIHRHRDSQPCSAVRTAEIFPDLVSERAARR